MLSRAAIYNHIWRDQRQGGDLYKHLRHASKPYRKRYGKPDGRPKAAKPSIDQWMRRLTLGTGPPARLDTVIGPNHKGMLLTLTKRSTNYLLMRRTSDKSAQEVRQAITAYLLERGLPVHTLTFDNGTEFADYERIATDLKVDFYRSGDPVCSCLSRWGTRGQQTQ